MFTVCLEKTGHTWDLTRLGTGVPWMNTQNRYKTEFLQFYWVNEVV